MALVNSSALVKSASSFTQVASVSSSSLPSSEEESVWYPGSESVAPSGIVGPLRAVSVLSSAVCWDFLSDEGPSPAISTTSEGVALKNTDNKSLQVLRAIPFRVIFFFSFFYLILSRSFIAFTLSDLADTDHHDAITWPYLLSHIGYEDR